MSRFTILNGTGAVVQIGVQAKDAGESVAIFGPNRVGGPYSARPETADEAARRERAAAALIRSYPRYTGD